MENRSSLRWSHLVLSITFASLGCSTPHPGEVSGDLSRFTSDSLRATSPARRDVEAEQPLPYEELSALAEAGPEHFVRLALERNPSIRAAQHTVERLAARVPQVTSLDDPMLEVAPIGEMAETAAGEVGLMAGVSQKLPFFGKLAARGDIASSEVSIAIQDLEQKRLDVVSQVRRSYWSYYFTTRAIEVTGVNRDLLAQFRGIAEAKYESGTASQQDVLRASVELSNLENELITLGQRRTTAIARLNSLVDRPVNAPIPEPQRVELEQVALSFEALLADAERWNPALKKMAERIELYRTRFDLARLQRWPDLTVSFRYGSVENDGLAPSANGRDQWWLGFGINLPIWLDRLNAGEREARQGMRESQASLSAEFNEVAFRLEEALTKVETKQRLAILFRDVIVPQARQTVDVSQSGYRSGTVDFLTLVDNWRQLLDFTLIYYRSLSELEESLAELQNVVGHDLQRGTGEEVNDER